MQTIISHPWILILILTWTLPWKGMALWKSARKGHLGWFLVLLILNTLAILDILYYFIFSKEKVKNDQETQAPLVRQPRVQNFQSEELKQKQLLEQEKQRQELEAKQARYAANKGKRLNIL